jgi:hypothetical protein
MLDRNNIPKTLPTVLKQTGRGLGVLNENMDQSINTNLIIDIGVF